jgi:formiminotetrahydrofolate cyclodeaminase
MASDLIKLPTEELLNKLGSGSHKPGSGSAAALLSLVACKLLQTVVTLSNGRSDYQGVKDQLTLANQDVVQDIEPKLLKAMQEDSLQFDKVISARRKRDSTKDAKERKALSEDALAKLRVATDIPIQIAELSVALAEKAMAVFDLGFKAARGDSGVAISAALSGASGALSIVYLNLTSFKGSEWAIARREKADDLFKRTQQLQIGLIERIGRLQLEVAMREGEAEIGQ